jgi:hypothetical protein
MPVMTISSIYTSKRMGLVGVLERNKKESYWLWTKEKRSRVDLNFSNHAWGVSLSHIEIASTYTQRKTEKKTNPE